MTETTPCTAPDEHYQLGALLPDDAIAAFAALPEFALDMAAAIPSSYSLPGIGRVPVLNQGNKPQCELYTDAGLIGLFDTRHGLPFREINEDAGYAAAQRIDGIPLPHEGTTDAAALTVAQQGLAYRSGSGRGHVGQWSRLGVEADTVRHALVQTGNPVAISWRWPHSWFHPDAQGHVGSPDYVAGGHRTFAVGYVSGFIVVRNSWGSGWGRGGNFLVPDAYFRGAAWGVQVVAPPAWPKSHTLVVADPTVRVYTRIVKRVLIASEILVVPVRHYACTAPEILLNKAGHPAQIVTVTERGPLYRKVVRVSASDGTSIAAEG